MRISKNSKKPSGFIFGFFGVHMLMFGLSGFVMAYASEPAEMGFRYAHGGLAIFVYLIFYFIFFGADRIKWMFINAFLGIMGIITQIDWILSFFNKRLDDYPFETHLIPFVYYILYTFLIHQWILFITNSNENEERKKKVEIAYVVVSIAFYGGTYFLRR